MSREKGILRVVVVALVFGLMGLWSQPAWAQWELTGVDIYYDAGRVGIGTDTPGAQLTVHGTEDRVQLQVRGNATQTEAIVEVEDQLGFPLFVVGEFNIGIGNDQMSDQGIRMAPEILDPNALRGIQIAPRIEAGRRGMAGIGLSATIRPSSDLDLGYGQIGAAKLGQAESDGISYDLDLFHTNYYETQFLQDYSGHVEILNNFRINRTRFADGSTGTIGELRGLSIDELSAGLANWAIYTEGGTPSFFGGNVGIGTLVPLEKLEVEGNIRASGTVCDMNGCLGEGADGLGDHLATQNLDLGGFKLVGNGGSLGLSIASNGVVSIGNTITIDGITDTITASGGTINFVGADLVTTGILSSDGLEFETLNCSGLANGGSLTTNADGVVICKDDEVGDIADTHSLDAEDGNPIDAVFVDGEGNVGIGTVGANASPEADLEIRGNLSRSLSGIASVTAGSITVSGVGTFFDSELRVGDAVGFGTERFLVTGIDSDELMYLDRPHPSGVLNAVPFSDTDLLILRNGAGAEALAVGRSGMLRISGRHAGVAVEDAGGVTHFSVIPDEDSPGTWEAQIDGTMTSSHSMTDTLTIAGLKCSANDNGGKLTTNADGQVRCADDEIGSTADGHSLDAADGDPSNVVFVDPEGKVGIGTDLPGFDLSVVGTLSVGRPGSTGGELLIRSESSGVFFDQTSPIPIVFQTQGSERLKIATDGSVSIPTLDCTTNSNGGKLTTDVDGHLLCTDDSYADGHSLDAQDGSSTDVVFVSSGTVSVGNSQEQVRLVVAGPIVSSGTGPQNGGLEIASTVDGNPLLRVSQSNGEPETTFANDSGDARLVIADSGRVGIGTPSPQDTLSITGDLGISNPGLTSATRLKISTSDAGAIISQRAIQPGDDSSIAFQTEGMERLKISSDGRIGIPALDCTTNSNGGKLTTDSDGHLVCADDSAGVADGHSLDAVDGSSTDVVFVRSGIVEVGNPQEQVRLQVAGPIFSSGTATQNGGLEIASTVPGKPLLQVTQENGEPKTVFANDNGVKRLVIAGTGRVGVGTETPQSTLSVSGTLGISEPGLTSVTRLRFSTSKSGAVINQDDNSPIILQTLGAERLRVDNGNIKVTGDLEVTGQITAAGCSGCGSSDRRLKQNIRPLELAGGRLEAIRPVTFEWIEGVQENKTLPGTQIGVIAQDVESMFPELVGTDSRGYKFVRYDKLVVPLLGVVKDQQRQIAELKSLVCRDHQDAEICASESMGARN